MYGRGKLTIKGRFFDVFTPETKKPTGRPVGGESKKWSTIFLFSRKILSTSKWRIFRVSKGGAFSLLEKFSDWISIV